MRQGSMAWQEMFISLLLQPRPRAAQRNSIALPSRYAIARALQRLHKQLRTLALHPTGPTCFMKSTTSPRTKDATPCSPFSSAFRPANSTTAAEESTPSAVLAPPAAAESAKPPEKQHMSSTLRPAASWRITARLSRWSA